MVFVKGIASSSDIKQPFFGRLVVNSTLQKSKKSFFFLVKFSCIRMAEFIFCAAYSYQMLIKGPMYRWDVT